METFDVAIVGGGPAGSSCGAFCAAAGLRTIVLEREKFPREKVCGDCLNPACWRVLRRLGIAERVRQLPHGILHSVEFIAIRGRKIVVDLPLGEESEIAVKRSLFDDLLLRRAGELGAHICEDTTVSVLSKSANSRGWRIETAGEKSFVAQALVGADGRNSTVARLCNLLPRPSRERIALQAHIPLPPDFGNRVILQFLPEGYSGEAPVNRNELNLCVVSKPSNMPALRSWAEKQFSLQRDHQWRTITPLTRAALAPAREKLFLVGDAARVVEPFTGEGIYYALRSGELAAQALVKIIQGNDSVDPVTEYTTAHAAMYGGRLWINQLARAAVLAPRFASVFVHLGQIQPSILRLLTAKIVRSN
jgi:geranylgeranyl reductase family protein